jgi:hypothetical protein
MEFKIINSYRRGQNIYQSNRCSILFTHLEEYGDKVEDILKCTDYDEP